MKSIVFRLGVLFHRRFCGLPILPGAETPRRARSDVHGKSKKALSTFVRRLPIVRRFHVAKGRSNAENRENGEGRQKEEKKKRKKEKNKTLLSPYSCQPFLVARVQRKRFKGKLDCPSWLTIYLIAIVFYAPSVTFVSVVRSGSFISLMFAKGVTKWRISCCGVEVSGSVKQ